MSNMIVGLGCEMYPEGFCVRCLLANLRGHGKGHGCEGSGLTNGVIHCWSPNSVVILRGGKTGGKTCLE